MKVRPAPTRRAATAAALAAKTRTALLLRRAGTTRVFGCAPRRPSAAPVGRTTTHAGTRDRARVPGAGPQERAGAGAPAQRAARPAPRHRLAADRRAGRGAAGARRPAHVLPGQAAQARAVQAVHHRLQVPAAGADRGRRDGGRVPVRAHPHEAAGGAQGAAGREAGRPLEPGAVLPRGPGGGGAGPPEHRPRLRHRPVREAALPGDGVRRRAQPAGDRRQVPDGEAGVRPGPGGALHRPGRGRHAARPRAGDGPPGHQARQPAAGPHRGDQGAGHGPGPVLQQAAGQRDGEVRREVRPGHGRLPGAGAGGVERGGRAGGHLLARRHAVLHADRADAGPTCRRASWRCCGR